MLNEAFNYKKWADLRTIKAVQKIDAKCYPSQCDFMRQQLNHILIVEELFKARLLQEEAPHESTNSDTLPTLKQLEQRMHESQHWFSFFVDKLTGMEKEKIILFNFADGKTGAMTVQEILFHLINHASYHRGAIGHALDLTANPHPADTYSLYIHSVEPERREHS